MEKEYIQHFGDIPCRLRAPFDFSFLEKYGEVFKIFDDQDSGNLCFCCDKSGEKVFIKLAGAPTVRYDGKIEDAIANLRASLTIYEAVKHPLMPEFIGSEDIPGGFALIFSYREGECMGKMYEESHKKFMASDISERTKVFEDIMSFLLYIASEGYVAVDFYDGSIMYDFSAKKTTICDIDFFRKAPAVNDMGRMWGSDRFMAPEEYKLGDTIDEITNVFSLGAMAFAMFTESDRAQNKWPLSEKQYLCALKATSAERSERQQSIKEFIHDWKEL